MILFIDKKHRLNFSQEKYSLLEKNISHASRMFTHNYFSLTRIKKYFPPTRKSNSLALRGSFVAPSRVTKELVYIYINKKNCHTHMLIYKE